ncbi:MAG TPA: hypothetical protein ENI80_02330 [Acidiferrobacteraceae bacterium]|nr:hypothetical protein [Acidiferrobacteraceae bacterium]
MLETKEGDAVAIHNLEGLHRAIGLDLVHHMPALTGDAVRFLRKEMNVVISVRLLTNCYAGCTWNRLMVWQFA